MDRLLQLSPSDAMILLAMEFNIPEYSEVKSANNIK